MKSPFEEVILGIFMRRKFDEPVKVVAYLESIGTQLKTLYPEDDKFVARQLTQASQIAAGYSNPALVLRELDEATEVYIRRRNSFDLFERITPSTPAQPRTLDDLQEELDFLTGGGR